MREILFRGKPKNLKSFGWITGQLFRHSEKISKIFSEEIDCPVGVIPETVGQFTGLTDRNGKKIFEGDIVTAMDEVWGSPFCYGLTGKIIYDETAFFIMPKDPMETQWLFNECAVYEVIGNIHDNPELLEVTDNTVATEGSIG